MINYPRPKITEIEHLLPNARQGAVLALVYPKIGRLHILLTLRHDYEGHHSGQVSFPGGKCEPDDSSPWITALREAEEEVGLSHHGLIKLGELSKVYIPPSNFLVHPFVALSTTTPKLKADPVEVKRLIEAPLEVILLPEALKQKTIQLKVPEEAVPVKYFDIEQETVWGATGMMLNELKHVILSSSED